jgi:hypothetical protein
MFVPARGHIRSMAALRDEGLPASHDDIEEDAQQKVIRKQIDSFFPSHLGLALLQSKRP